MGLSLAREAFLGVTAGHEAWQRPVGCPASPLEAAGGDESGPISAALAGGEQPRPSHAAAGGCAPPQYTGLAAGDEPGRAAGTTGRPSAPHLAPEVLLNPDKLS